MTAVKFVDNVIEFLDADDGHCFYDLAISEIHRDGLEFWLDHLSCKNWFTNDVKNQFLALLK